MPAPSCGPGSPTCCPGVITIGAAVAPGWAAGAWSGTLAVWVSQFGASVGAPATNGYGLAWGREVIRPYGEAWASSCAGSRAVNRVGTVAASRQPRVRVRFMGRVSVDYRAGAARPVRGVSEAALAPGGRE